MDDVTQVRIILVDQVYLHFFIVNRNSLKPKNCIIVFVPVLNNAVPSVFFLFILRTVSIMTLIINVKLDTNDYL